MASKVGTVISDNYTDITTIQKDVIYQWVRATDKRSGKQVVFQVLLPALQNLEVDVLRRYFDQLMGASRSGIYAPTEILSDAANKLVLCYEDLNLVPLEKTASTKAELRDYFKQASEALHVLHNKDLYHGFISPASLGIVNGFVWLTNFGYARLLDLDYEAAFRIVDSYVAPECRKGQEGKPVSDVYSFAQMVRHFVPEIEGTAWYRRASDSDPGKRLQPMRKVQTELDAALDGLGFTPVLEDLPAQPGPALLPAPELPSPARAASEATTMAETVPFPASANGTSGRVTPLLESVPSELPVSAAPSMTPGLEPVGQVIDMAAAPPTPAKGGLEPYPSASGTEASSNPGLANPAPGTTSPATQTAVPTNTQTAVPVNAVGPQARNIIDTSPRGQLRPLLLKLILVVIFLAVLGVVGIVIRLVFH